MKFRAIVAKIYLDSNAYDILSFHHVCHLSALPELLTLLKLEIWYQVAIGLSAFYSYQYVLRGCET